MWTFSRKMTVDSVVRHTCHRLFTQQPVLWRVPVDGNWAWSCTVAQQGTANHPTLQPVLYVPLTDDATMCSIQFVFLGKVIFCRACTAEKPRMMACDDEKQPLAVEAVAWMPIDVKIDVPMKGLSAKPLLRSLRRHSQRYSGQLRSAHASRASRAVPSPCSAKRCAPRCSQLIRPRQPPNSRDVSRRPGAKLARSRRAHLCWHHQCPPLVMK
jgi:hypothetical protein